MAAGLAIQNLLWFIAMLLLLLFPVELKVLVAGIEVMASGGLSLC